MATRSKAAKRAGMIARVVGLEIDREVVKLRIETDREPVLDLSELVNEVVMVDLVAIPQDLYPGDVVNFHAVPGTWPASISRLRLSNGPILIDGVRHWQVDGREGLFAEANLVRISR